MRIRGSIGSHALVSTLLLAGTAARAQQRAPTAPPPIAWPSPPLADGPIVLDTGIRHQIRLIVTKGLTQPWSMAFLPDGAILVTERPGRLRIVRNGVLDPAPVTGVPQVQSQGLAGLMDLALHPRFSENKLIYFTYHKPVAAGPGVITLARGRWDGVALAEVHDGTVPPDNPFVNRAGYRPEVYTMGHRNALGLAVQPDTGAIWECENGPNGGDEINVLQPGKNYGWPIVSYGGFYLGPRVSVDPWKEGMEPPLVFWVPAIAISGMTFYTGDKFPNWKNHVFVGGMRQGEVPRSGHLERIDFNEKWEELHRESMLREIQQRIRDVRQGPDGLLYVLTAENEGALMRIEPWGMPEERAPEGKSK